MKAKIEITNSLMEDLSSNLFDVQRWWIRIPCAIIVTSIHYFGLMVIDAYYDILDAADFFYNGWKGDKEASKIRGQKRLKKYLEML
jgi:hypothetical protein